MLVPTLLHYGAEIRHIKCDKAPGHRSHQILFVFLFSSQLKKSPVNNYRLAKNASAY
jgi:hypothetical protein